MTLNYHLLFPTVTLSENSDIKLKYVVEQEYIKEYPLCMSTLYNNNTVETWTPSMLEIRSLLCYTGVVKAKNYLSYDNCYHEITYANIRYLHDQVLKACTDSSKINKMLYKLSNILDYSFNNHHWLWYLAVFLPIIAILIIIIILVSN